MYRASIILKNAREDHSLEISEVSKKLKISAKYIEAIETCEKAGMDVIIIDSISHEWEGNGGILEGPAAAVAPPPRAKEVWPD